MQTALKDLHLDHLGGIYPGTDIFPLDENIMAYGLDSLAHKTFQEKISILIRE